MEGTAGIVKAHLRSSIIGVDQVIIGETELPENLFHAQGTRAHQSQTNFIVHSVRATTTRRWANGLFGAPKGMWLIDYGSSLALGLTAGLSP